MEYNLEERTLKFSEDLIDFIKTIKITSINRSIVSQLIRAGTSIGANYCEANGASSKKDFRNKIYICKKEAKETKYWLKLLTKVEINRKNEINKFYKEAQEFILIFSKIVSTINKSK